jgi:hypothetical protein
VGSACDAYRLSRNGTTSTVDTDLFSDDSIVTNPSIDCEKLLGSFGNERYAVDTYYRTGSISLMVTVANIILIWISSMLMFRMKEVLPIKKNIFWDDLSIARKVYQKRALVRIDQILASDVGFSSTSAPVAQDNNQQ